MSVRRKSLSAGTIGSSEFPLAKRLANRLSEIGLSESAFREIGFSKSRAAKSLKMAQPFCGALYSPDRCSVEQHSRLIAILPDSITLHV